MSEVFKVAVAGLGTVGGGVVRLLREQQDVLLKRCGRLIELTAVADLNPDRAAELNLPASVAFYQDAREMAEKTDADVIIELIGGADGIAYELCLSTLNRDKSFITANKAMIAHHGNELARLAEEHGVFSVMRLPSPAESRLSKRCAKGWSATGFPKFTGF